MNPIPMRLPCPSCGALHVDEGEFATKPHHTHACQECGMVWRPAVVHTVGVRFLPGYRNEENEMKQLTDDVVRVGDIPIGTLRNANLDGLRSGDMTATLVAVRDMCGRLLSEAGLDEDGRPEPWERIPVPPLVEDDDPKCCTDSDPCEDHASPDENEQADHPERIARTGPFVRFCGGVWQSFIDGNYLADHATREEAENALAPLMGSATGTEEFRLEYEFVVPLRHAWKAGDPAGVRGVTDVYICGRCGALVADRDLHTSSHPTEEATRG